jgi:hypothetical protein
MKQIDAMAVLHGRGGKLSSAARKCGSTMCEKCDEIDKAIARYKRLKDQILDSQATEAADRLIAKLEAAKAALHPEE